MEYDTIYLGSKEWGNQIMTDLARQHFATHPDVEFVEVHEHGGWWLGYRRDGSIWATANDAADPAGLAGSRPERWSGREVRR